MGILKRFGVGASAGALEPTSIPTTVVVGEELDSVSFSITNTDIEAVSISWEIRAGTQTGSIVASNTVNNVQPNASITASASSLTQATTYWLTGVFATAGNRPQSEEAVRRSTTTLRRTSTPTAIALSPTTSSVTFEITNTDTQVASVTWLITILSPSGSPVISGTQNNVASNGSFTVTATDIGGGLSESQFQYWLTEVYATASSAVTSFKATDVSSTTLPVVVRPTVTAGSATSSSVIFNIKNEDDANAFFSWNIRQGASTNPVLSFGTTGNTAPQGTAAVTQTGLNASTTYWMTDVVGKSSNSTKADARFIPNPVSNTTSAAPPPFFPPFFAVPPFFPPFFAAPPPPPFFPPFFAVPPPPPFFPPFFQAIPPFFPPFFVMAAPPPPACVPGEPAPDSACGFACPGSCFWAVGCADGICLG